MFIDDKGIQLMIAYSLCSVVVRMIKLARRATNITYTLPYISNKIFIFAQQTMIYQVSSEAVFVSRIIAARNIFVSDTPFDCTTCTPCSINKQQYSKCTREAPRVLSLRAVDKENDLGAVCVFRVSNFSDFLSNILIRTKCRKLFVE